MMGVDGRHLAADNLAAGSLHLAMSSLIVTSLPVASCQMPNTNSGQLGSWQFTFSDSQSKLLTASCELPNATGQLQSHRTIMVVVV